MTAAERFVAAYTARMERGAKGRPVRPEPRPWTPERREYWRLYMQGRRADPEYRAAEKVRRELRGLAREASR